jgi:mannosyltransferase
VLNWLVVLLPGLAELLVGGYRIGGPSLWRDEGYTREVVQRSVSGIIALLGHQDAVHGLYYLLMHPIATVLGTSPTVLRIPSLAAACLAASLTAALGRRLASDAGLPAASATGLLAGLLLVAIPLTTWYAQDARPYAMATLCAVAATYLLVRGRAGRSRWWWAGYGAIIVVLALLDLLALPLVAAHGLSLLVMRGRPRGTATCTGTSTGTGTQVDARPGSQPAAWRASPAVSQPAAMRRWLVATAAAIVVLSPLIVLGQRQAGQIGWITRPGMAAVDRLISGFAGSEDLIPLVTALALFGAVADVSRRSRLARAPAVVTVPWLVIPPVLLLAVSQVHPLYVERYVVFCLPAAALLTAGGLTWLARLAALMLPGSRWRALTVLPSALLVALIAAILVEPQQAIRLTPARTDNLRAVAAVVAAHERPGDAILYLPWNARVVGLTYPGPFRGLRDISLGTSATASATLTGLPAPEPDLASRLAHVPRLWTVRWTSQRQLSHPQPFPEQSALVSRMHLIRTWRIKSVTLSLYAAD